VFALRKPSPEPNVAYVIDRDQSAIENYAISIWIAATVSCYLAPYVTWWLALPVALIAIQIPIYATGLLFNNRRVNGVVIWLLLAVTSYWGGWVGWVFYGVVAANAIAWLILLPTRTKILGFAAIAPLIAIALFLDRRWIEGIAVIVASHALILYPTLAPNAQWLGPVVTCFETDRDEVWLTIDDGPADDTPALRELLARRGVPATLFVVGKCEGEDVANHSATHPSATFWCLGPRRIAEEIDGGVASRRFRAPVGMKNPFVHPALARRGMRLIGWSVRGFDATRGDVDAIAKRIASRTRRGAIIVMHQGRAWSLTAIERVIDELQARGFTFVIPGDERLR
jgi:peptidoglycan/xylan/chitin deacetylase (PgdA/CDA1 family)